jgi:hypothetical protein
MIPLKRIAVLNTSIQYRLAFFQYGIQVLSTALIFPGICCFQYWYPSLLKSDVITQKKVVVIQL